jgi:hypothetical protein
MVCACISTGIDAETPNACDLDLKDKGVMRQSIILLPSVLVAICGITYSAEADSETTELVDAVLARAESVLTGRFEYRIKNGVPLDGKQLDELHAAFILAGPSWRVDNLDLHVERINHNGYYLEVRKTPQKDGSIHTSLEIHGTESLGKAPPYPPFFAGTFWYKSTAAYIAAHKDDARLTGEQVIKGMPVKVLEWNVSEKDKYDAFYTITELLMNGGILRVYVSPQLGYALPCIEYLDHDGFVERRFDAEDFQEVAKTVYMPKRFSDQVFGKNGTLGWCDRYEIIEMNSVNQPIPDDAFSTHLPAGTVVADRRTSKSHDFVIGNLDGSLKDLNIVVENTAKPIDRSFKNAFLIGTGIALGFCVVTLIWRRFRSRSGKASGAEQK